jgi:hypothetical protein
LIRDPARPGSATPARDLASLPFDQYQRYRAVARLLDAARGESTRLAVLDVGGAGGSLQDFLPRDRVVVVDRVAHVGTGRAVFGDGGSLPFRSGAFDAAVGVDVLEHVPAAFRLDLIEEMGRVARGIVVLAGPFRTAGVERAEGLARLFLREARAFEHDYLEEHARFGLPTLSAAARALRGLGARVRGYRNGRLARWAILMPLELFLDADPTLRGFRAEWNRFYNRRFFEADLGLDPYRHLLVGVRGGRPLPPRDLFGDPRDRAHDAGAPSADELTALLLKLEDAQKVWSGEARLRVETERLLREDLEQSKRVIAEHERNLAEARAEAVTLRRDLEGHRTSLAEATEGARAESGALRARVAELEAEAEAVRKVVSDLESNLRGYKLALADRENEASGLRRTLLETRSRLFARGAGPSKLDEVEALRAALHGALRALDGSGG